MCFTPLEGGGGGGGGGGEEAEGGGGGGGLSRAISFKPRFPACENKNTGRPLVLRIIANFSGHLCSAYRPRVAREVMSTSSRGLLSAPHLSPSERRQTQIIQHGVVAVFTDHRREFRAVLQTPIPKRREDIVQ